MARAPGTARAGPWGRADAVTLCPLLWWEIRLSLEEAGGSIFFSSARVLVTSYISLNRRVLLDRTLYLAAFLKFDKKGNVFTEKNQA